MYIIKIYIECIIKGIKDTIDHDGVEHAGYLAFLIMLSLFPFLVFVVALIGFIGQMSISEHLLVGLINNEVIPQQLINVIEPRISEILSGPPQGLLTIAILGIIWTASSAVEGLRTILNRAYRISSPPAYIFRRTMSIFQFILVTVIIISVTLVLIIAPSLWEKINASLELGLPSLNNIFNNLRYLITGFTLFLVVTTLYYIIPNARHSFFSSSPGAILVVIAWFISGNMLSLYIKNFDQVNIVYGSLGSVIITLIFFYLIAMIFIFGAEFNYHYKKSKEKMIDR